MGAKASLILHLALCAISLSALSCEDSIVLVDLSAPEPPDDPDPDTDDPPDVRPPTTRVVVSGDTIFVVDRTGKHWDVTHAANQYGFEPEGFEFGLGPNAIKPIMYPVMLCAGDAGFPLREEDELIMGVNLNKLTRAYPLPIMSKREVVNEVFGDAHVAVAY